MISIGLTKRERGEIFDVIKRLMDWWNKTQEITQSNASVERCENVSEEEYKYETTLVRDLGKIVNLLGKEFPEFLVEDLFVDKYKNKVSFYSRKIDFNQIREAIDLKSLETDKQWETIKTARWTADLNEYQRVYHSKYLKHANTVRELLSIVKENLSNPYYLYIFLKYEDSILIVANTLKEDRDNNGEIREEVFQKAKEIIRKCAAAIAEKYKELEHIEELQKEAVNKSLVDRLVNESEFMDKYIEKQM